MCWLCGFKSQMLSVSTFCVFVCQHLCICVLCTCSFTSTLLCVWTPCGTSVPPSTSNTGAPKGHQLKKERDFFGEPSIPRRDGRNESSRDTFPCHYNPSKPNSTDQFVTIRLNILHSMCILYSSPSILSFNSRLDP